RELALQTETPLVDIGRVEVRIDARCNDGRNSGECIRNVRPIRGLKRARCLPQTEWRVARQRRQAVSYDLMVVEGPKPGSYDGARPSEGTPWQTNAGAEIGFVRPAPPSSALRP